MSERAEKVHAGQVDVVRKSLAQQLVVFGGEHRGLFGAEKVANRLGVDRLFVEKARKVGNREDRRVLFAQKLDRLADGVGVGQFESLFVALCALFFGGAFPVETRKESALVAENGKSACAQRDFADTRLADRGDRQVAGHGDDRRGQVAFQGYCVGEAFVPVQTESVFFLRTDQRLIDKPFVLGQVENRLAVELGSRSSGDCDFAKKFVQQNECTHPRLVERVVVERVFREKRECVHEVLQQKPTFEVEVIEET